MRQSTRLAHLGFAVSVVGCFAFPTTNWPCSSSTTMSRVNIPAPLRSMLPDDVQADEYCQVLDEFGCQAFETLLGEESEDFRWIRVEKNLDASLADIKTQKDVLLQIERVKRDQRRTGRCDLYGREWQPSGDLDDDYPVNGEGGEKPVISVIQFNALAEGLSSGPSAKKPFRIDPTDSRTQVEKQGQGYGGFTNIPSPEDTLDYSTRRWRLLEVILGSDRGSLFDIVAMEEVDRFVGFFAPMLRLFGYDGLFVPKTRSPCVRMGWYSDGCSLFWKKDTFELLSERRRVFSVGSQVYMIVVLRHRVTGHSFVVAVTHLKAQMNQANEKIRCRQVEELLDQLTRAVKVVSKDDVENGVSVLVLGDFNADPPHYLRDVDESAVQKVLDYELLLDGDEGNKLQSAYDLASDEFYTTWKTRGSDTVKRIIDYIFYSGSRLRCLSTLQVPSERQLEATKLPGRRYPSDHMMIAAKFSIE